MGRRRYTAEFKPKVVVEAMRGDATVREIARRGTASTRTS